MKQVKKISILIIVLVFTFVLFGCGKEQYTVTLLSDDGTMFKELVVLEGETIELGKIEKKGYTFEGWVYEDKLLTSLSGVKENISLSPQFKINQYTYKFIVDGKVIKEEIADYGTTIDYPEDPIKEDTVESNFTFVKWDNDATILEEDEIFKAVFLEGVNQYTYKFVVDGQVIKEETVDYYSTIEFPIDPEKEGTEQYLYKFVGWDNESKVVTGDLVFNAIFKEILRKYTYMFIVDGEVIKEETVDYGTEISYPSDPTKESVDGVEYKFVGWDNNAKIVNGDLVFSAIFSEIVEQYTYKFVVDGEVIKEETVDKGTLPIAPNNPTKETVNGVKYKFIGWDKEIKAITEDITYTAIFEEIAPVTSLEGLKLSILGDSISTFYAEGSVMNSYYGGEKQFYYPIYSSTIKTVDLTWWYKLLKNTKMELGINNSWSGSCASGSGPSAGQNDGRIFTIDDNGMPDVVIIYLGTNDCVSGVSTEEFGRAIETMITKIRNLGETKILITTLGYSAYKGASYKEETRISYNERIREIADTYNCGIVPLDDYIVNDNYMIYLGDNLHYNAKGADLLSKIFEKSINEYFGFKYDKEIEVEHQEVLPEGVLGKITVTSNGDFWKEYASNVFLYSAEGAINPQFSLRIEITLNKENNKYYVTNIYKSGETKKCQGDYVLILSDDHSEKMSLEKNLANVVVGSIVEFDVSGVFPKEVVFKNGDGNGPSSGNPETPENPDVPNIIEGQLHVGAYNTGVWSLYESTVMAYSYDSIDKNSTFIYFNMIKLTKNTDDENYTITGLKPSGTTEDFTSCDYYILIYSSLSEKTYFENANIGDQVIINGDITSGNCNLEFK